MKAPITTLVEQAILDRMRAKVCFTALDVSNGLKASRYPVKHRQVAAAVREIYQSGAMAYYDYTRELIPVVTEGGAKQTKALMYRHEEIKGRHYTSRDLEALPSVPPDEARDLADSVAAGSLPILPRPPYQNRQRARKRQVRRDGALAIPRALIAKIGWTPGMQITLSAEPGKLTLDVSNMGMESVKVWSGQRVRICKTKLRLGALTAEAVILEIEGDALGISAIEADLLVK